MSGIETTNDQCRSTPTVMTTESIKTTTSTKLLTTTAISTTIEQSQNGLSLTGNGYAEFPSAIFGVSHTSPMTFPG